MTFILHDCVGVLVATPTLALILVLPGFLFAEILAFPGFRDTARGLERLATALLVGAASTPVLLDLAGHAGPTAMAALALFLSAAGAVVAFRRGRFAGLFDNRGPLFFAVCLVWFLVATALLVDWPDGEGLRRSMQSADHVKHAAATWAIAQSGAPPYNPTFFDPAVKSAYYYFFYNLTATAMLIAAPFGVVARQAAWAGVILSGPILFATAWLVYTRSSLDRLFTEKSERRLFPWLLTLLATTGLDMIPVALVGGLMFHTWITDYEWWDTQVTSWLNSVIWVPHHVTGLAAAWVGFLSLSGAERGARSPALAGLAFASCAGLSIYLGFGAALTAAGFLIWLALEKRWSDIARWCAAGAIAALVAAPWLMSLIAGRLTGGDPPVAFEIRAVPIFDIFVAAEPWRSLGRLLTLPIAYAIEFGVYLLGSIAFWRRAGARGLDGDVAKLLVVGCAVSFLVGTFLRSTVLLNDLGWRIMLFAQMASLVWTLAAVRGGLFDNANANEPSPWMAGLVVCVLMGFAADGYGAVQMRLYAEETPAEAAMAPDERAAWEWMSARLPANAVVEENPDRDRAFGYGLYGHFRESVSDYYNGVLFGSSKTEVERRIRAVKPIFTDIDLTAGEAMAAASKADIGYVVIRSLDPVFINRNAWPWSVNPVFANDNMLVVAVERRAFAGGPAK